MYYAIDGCHYWTGYIDTKGYGHFKINGKMDRAHCGAFMLYRAEIPEGMHVLHTCDNPPCVNPDHLFLGTNKDNIADKVSKNRQYRPLGEKHPQARLKASQVLEIRNNHGVLSGNFLANTYGVTTDYIFEIWSKKSWKHL